MKTKTPLAFTPDQTRDLKLAMISEAEEFLKMYTVDVSRFDHTVTLDLPVREARIVFSHKSHPVASITFEFRLDKKGGIAGYEAKF